MTDPSSGSLREEIDLDAWEVDDLPDAFADAVLDAIEADGESQTIAPLEPRPAAARSRGWVALAAGGLAAAAVAAVVALWRSPDEAPSPAAFDGVTVTAEDERADWRWLSTSAQSSIAEQSSGRVRWDAQRGVPLTVQTPAGRVTTTRADFSLEVLDMPRLSLRKDLAIGAAFTGTIAALVYMHAGDVEVANDAGAMKLSSPKQAVMSDAEAPREVQPPEPVNEADPVSPTPKPDWSAARVGIRKALDARAAAAREEQPDDRDPDRDGPSSPPFGTLDKDYIRNTVREEVVPLVRECYNDLLEQDPDTAGRMVLKFTIMGDESVGGIVEEMEFGADSDIKDESFRECVAETMRSTVFAPPEGGGFVVVTYPFIFTTDPDDGGDGGDLPEGDR